MFYKKEEDNSWLVAIEIVLPTEEILDVNNQENVYGWVWQDTPPVEYLVWLEIQNSISDFDDYEEIID